MRLKFTGICGNVEFIHSLFKTCINSWPVTTYLSVTCTEITFSMGRLESTREMYSKEEKKNKSFSFKKGNLV